MQTKLAKLRALIATATDLSRIWDYFHAHCASDPRFFQRATPGGNATLDELIASTAARLTRAAAAPLVGRYLCIDGLWHGAGTVGGRSFLVVWDERAGVGAACFSTRLTDPLTDYVRFRTVPLPAGGFVGKGGTA